MKGRGTNEISTRKKPLANVGNGKNHYSSQANRRYPIEFVSYWFYNIISFAQRALPAPVAELVRSAAY
jgi:hypothetical protein